MGLKILHSADWHLDSPFASFSSTQRTALRRWQQKLPGMIAELCQQEHCDLVLLAGDLLDSTACSPETLEALKAGLAACAVPVLIAPGNHDYCCPGSPWLEESWPKNVYIFTKGLESVSIPPLDCRIYGAGYQSMDCSALLEDFHAEGTERWKIGLLHGDPTNSSSPCCPITAAQVRESGLDYLALGHIHQAGGFQIEDTVCAWPGAPMGRGWDETGDKGIVLMTLDETPSIQVMALDTPRFYEYAVDLDTASLEEVLPPAANEHFYRVTLTGVSDISMDERRKRWSHLPNLEFIDKTEAPADIWAEAGEDSLRGIYFDMLRKLQSPTAQKAAELSYRLLNGKEVSLP